MNTITQMLPLKDEIDIKGIYTLIYQEKTSDFLFPGETHDFWELIYMDKGYVYLLVEDAGFKINQGELFFFNRNQNHILWSDSKVSPFFLTISFDMDIPTPEMLQLKRFIANDEIKEIMKKITAERVNSYEGGLNSYVIGSQKKDSEIFCNQMLKLLLTELVIKLIRSNECYKISTCNKSSDIAATTIRKKTEEIIFAKTSYYIESKLLDTLTAKNVCEHVSISHSQLNRIFNRVAGVSISRYITAKKLEKAKELIISSGLNISQISNALAFSTVHYFSRQFSKEFNISPREYSKSIKN